jgi:hypothetical protein
MGVQAMTLILTAIIIGVAVLYLRAAAVARRRSKRRRRAARRARNLTHAWVWDIVFKRRRRLTYRGDGKGDA